MASEDTEKYKHILRCGSCKYKKNGRCIKLQSDCWREIVDDDCSCEFYIPRRIVYEW